MRYFLNILTCAIVLPFQYPAVALLLLTKWDGRSTVFGNEKWGRANNHYSHATKGYWQEFLWLTYRNPINNMMNRFAVKRGACILYGDREIGDKIAGGFYRIKMGEYWEIYWVYPYGKHCIRVRLGWKIEGKQFGEMCPMVFAVRPIMNYRGK